MKKTTSGFATATMTKKMSSRALGAVLSLVTVCAPLAVSAHAAAFVEQRGPVSRSVQGVVQNSAGTNVKGAVVYLKDTKSLAVKSFVSTDEGTFHFGQLSQETDYDIWAEMAGKKSKTKSISQFNSKNQFTYTLKIED